MDCRTFEHEVARRLAGSAEDGPSIAALEEHASTCAVCRADADLLRLAAVEPARRFPFADPGPERWAAIEERLDARLEEERRGRRRGGLTAVAASVAAAFVGALMLAGSSWSVRGPTPAEIVATVPDDDLVWDGGGIPPEGLDWADPTRPDAGRPAPVPDLGALDDRERQELLEWIRDEMARIEGDAA